MAWDSYYRGDGSVHPVRLGPPPPWRVFPRRPQGVTFRPPAGLTTAVNAALSLRRPLLLTGVPGSGKSTMIESVAEELSLGPVLRWHVTSRSTLSDALYTYDVLGRIHDQQLKTAQRVAETADSIAPFLRLGPLGTALVPSERPRALLIDEIDKSDLDLPSDLLNVFERGEYEIPELVRDSHSMVEVRTWDSDRTYPVLQGRVICTEFPFIVMTSNEEREFPPEFLRRCIRFVMPIPSEDGIRQIVFAHLNSEVSEARPVAELVRIFAARLASGETLAIDQLLNAVFMLSEGAAPTEVERAQLTEILLRDLTDA